MKRPHRSIETFDISLMAVVTKAMGAFLVLMLLLIPYYKSGPIAQKPIDDLAKKIEEVNKDIKDVVDELTTGSAEDLRKLLDKALKALDDARKLIAELQRAIDQLNAQVIRLTDENAALKAQVEQLQKDKDKLTAEVEQLKKDKEALTAQVTELKQKIDTLKATIAELQSEIDPLKAQIADLQKKNEELKKVVDPLKEENEELKDELNQLNSNTIMGEALSLECQGVKFAIGLGTKEMIVTRRDKSKLNYVLDYSNGLGYAYDTQLAGTKYISAFLFRGASPGTYYLFWLSRSTDETPGDDEKINPLKQPLTACNVLINITAKLKNGELGVLYSNTFTLQLDKYAVILFDIVVTDDKISVNNDPSPEGLAWLKDQLDHADKVTGTERSAPAAPAPAAPPQSAPRKAPGFNPFSNNPLEKNRGFPNLPSGVRPPGGQR